jgi:hypothetical protein
LNDRKAVSNMIAVAMIAGMAVVVGIAVVAGMAGMAVVAGPGFTIVTNEAVYRVFRIELNCSTRAYFRIFLFQHYCANLFHYIFYVL